MIINSVNGNFSELMALAASSNSTQSLIDAIKKLEQIEGERAELNMQEPVKILRNAVWQGDVIEAYIELAELNKQSDGTISGYLIFNRDLHVWILSMYDGIWKPGILT